MSPTVFVFSLVAVLWFPQLLDCAACQVVSLASAAETMYGRSPDSLQLIAHSLPCIALLQNRCRRVWVIGVLGKVFLRMYAAWSINDTQGVHFARAMHVAFSYHCKPLYLLTNVRQSRLSSLGAAYLLLPFKIPIFVRIVLRFIARPLAPCRNSTAATFQDGSDIITSPDLWQANLCKVG